MSHLESPINRKVTGKLYERCQQLFSQQLSLAIDLAKNKFARSKIYMKIVNCLVLFFAFKTPFLFSFTKQIIYDLINIETSFRLHMHVFMTISFPNAMVLVTIFRLFSLIFCINFCCVCA